MGDPFALSDDLIIVCELYTHLIHSNSSIYDLKLENENKRMLSVWLRKMNLTVRTRMQVFRKEVRNEEIHRVDGVRIGCDLCI